MTDGSTFSLADVLRSKSLIGFLPSGIDQDGGGTQAKAAFVGEVARRPDLDVLIANSNPSPVAGDTFVYTIFINNTPALDAGPANSGTVENLLPANLTFVSASTASGTYDPVTGRWNFGFIDQGGSASLQITTTVNAAGPIVNNATITNVNPPDSNTFNNSTTNTVIATCYVTGTRIRTTRGEMAVEALAIGDHVVTASGEHRPIKWIGTRAYAPRFANANPEVLLPVCFKAGSIADGVPVRDLWVSPKHAMFLDGVLIPAQQLVNGVSIVKAERVDSLGYWHVELDSHDVLIAEGAPSESFVDDEGRGIFHNAHEFHALYPDARPVEAVYCAPRVEDGYALEAVRRRLAERAGLRLPAEQRLGELRGFVDGWDGETVWGWAQDTAYPDAPVCLDILVDGVLIARTYAQSYRPDLAAAGIGDGCHGFAVRSPLGVTARAHSAEVEAGSAQECAARQGLGAVIDRKAIGNGSSVEVRRSADGAALVAGPRQLAA